MSDGDDEPPPSPPADLRRAISHAGRLERHHPALRRDALLCEGSGDSFHDAASAEGVENPVIAVTDADDRGCSAYSSAERGARCTAPSPPSTPSSDWADTLETVFVEWARICRACAQRNKKKYHRNRRMQQFIMVPIIILSNFTGSAGVTSRINEMTQYGLAAIMLIVSVLTSVEQFYQFSHKAEEHKALAERFNKLAQDIDIELSKPSSTRADVNKFVLDTMQAYRELVVENQMTNPIDETIHELHEVARDAMANRRPPSSSLSR
jgi:hypothetical protein